MEVAGDVKEPAEEDGLLGFGLGGVRDELVGLIDGLSGGEALLDKFREAGLPFPVEFGHGELGFGLGISEDGQVEVMPGGVVVFGIGVLTAIHGRADVVRPNGCLSEEPALLLLLIGTGAEFFFHELLEMRTEFGVAGEQCRDLVTVRRAQMLPRHQSNDFVSATGPSEGLGGQASEGGEEEEWFHERMLPEASRLGNENKKANPQAGFFGKINGSRGLMNPQQ